MARTGNTRSTEMSTGSLGSNQEITRPNQPSATQESTQSRERDARASPDRSNGTPALIFFLARKSQQRYEAQRDTFVRPLYISRPFQASSCSTFLKIAGLIRCERPASQIKFTSAGHKTGKRATW